MKTTKFMLTGFAIFAAVLMLLTPCMARPVAEKTSMDAVEQNIEDINAVIDELSVDRNVMYAMRLIGRAGTEEEFLAGFEQLGFALESNSDFMQLEYILIEDDDSPIDVDGGQAQWAGFLRNMDGAIYVPDVGWITPDDPDYNDWLTIEDILRGSGLCPGDVFAILTVICAFTALSTYIIAFILSMLGFIDVAELFIILFMVSYFGIFIFAWLNDLYFEKYPPG